MSMFARLTLSVLAIAPLLAIASAGTAAGQSLDPAKPQDAVILQRKLQCSLTDGKAVRYWWQGRMYARVPGERDRLLFDLQGTNVRQCVTVTDPKRGTGYRLVSREILLYLDPKTGAVAKTWLNPWTNETVEVIQTANDPVNSRGPVLPFDEAGNPSPGATFPGEIKGGKALIAIEVPLFYPNPLGGDYQPYIGGTYHAMEVFDFFADGPALVDPKRDLPDAEVAWLRLSPWMPWMKMGDRQGTLVFNAVGKRVAPGLDDLPPVLKTAISADYPTYADPPPLDDTRPNETSWTYFKKKVPVQAPPGR
jgi:hypothetical protein